jgi:hypothetical protein
MRKGNILLGLIVSAVILSACGGAPPTSAPTAAPLPTVAPSWTPARPTVPPPAATPVPTIAAEPVRAATVAIEAPACDCTDNLYNCDDFATGIEAQKCFDYCMAQTGDDVHALDRDGDGLVCETDD